MSVFHESAVWLNIVHLSDGVMDVCPLALRPGDLCSIKQLQNRKSNSGNRAGV